MKIVHVIEATATGTLTMASLLANKQVEAGHDVTVIFSRRPETPGDLNIFFLKDVKLVNIQMCFLKDKLLSLFLLRKFIKKLSPTFVFLHSSFAGFLGRLSLIAMLQSPKVYYLPHCVSFMRKDVGFFMRSAFVVFEWIGAIKKSEFVACSVSEEKAIKKAVPFRKCHVVENSVDLSKAPNDFVSGYNIQEKVVISIGHIRKQKGPKQFAKIARIVKGKDPSVSFVWVGDGPLEKRKELENAGVTIMGWVPKDEVWKLLKTSSLYLSTSKWEGMPVSIIEACSAGLPVVAARCSGNLDVIEHSKTGWLFEASTEGAQIILDIIDGTLAVEAQTQLAFAQARKRFSTERYMNEMNVLIRE